MPNPRTPEDSATRSPIPESTDTLPESAASPRPAGIRPASGGSCPPATPRSYFPGGARGRFALWLALGWGCGWLAALALALGMRATTDAILGADLALGCSLAALAGTLVVSRVQKGTPRRVSPGDLLLRERLSAVVDLELEFNPSTLQVTRAAGSSRLLGMPPETLAGRSMAGVWPESAWERQTFWLTQEAEKGDTADLQFLHVDGSARDVRATVSVGSSPELCWLGLRDVTAERARQHEIDERAMAMEFTNGYITELNQDLERSRQELEAAKERLAELNDSKSRFLAVAAHELRTPMTAAKTAVSVLQNGMMGPINVQQGEVLGIIHQNVDRLVRLVNELLDLARIEAGKVELGHQEFQVAALLKQCCDLMAAEAGRKGIRIHVDSEPLVWVADPDRVEQVVLNVLGNAVKFTPGNGSVLLRSERTEDGLRIEVRDSGAGISAEELPRLFRPFERLSNEVTRKAAGTGLGLSISRELVELHGGRIWAESVPGEGTRICFVLPERATHEPRAQVA